jgi:hypothetical protein
MRTSVPNTPRVGASVFLLLLIGCSTNQGDSYGKPPPPADILGAAPASLSFAAIGASAAQSLTITFTQPDVVVTETDSCGSSGVRIASVNSANKSPQNVQYTVTPTAIGNCDLYFKDSTGASLTVPILVTK